jgi:large subunit ribosomal protein L4
LGGNVKLDVYKTNGSKAGEQKMLAKDIFGIEPNDHAIWLAVTAELTNRRQGNAATKNRSLVRGGGRKPWRQKGRGTARAGTIRSPLWVGGGRIFGPEPRCYRKKIPRKLKTLARKSALTYKARDEKIRLIEDFTFESPKTKQMAEILKKQKLDTIKTLLLLPENNRTLWLSGRNIPSLAIREISNFSTYDVMNADTLIIQKSALDKIKEVLAK